ncbi:MAG: hypothetical protein Q9207_004200 [Kuettlingeria erythrocarpa]
MASTDARILGEVLQEVEGVLVVRKQLEKQNPLHAIFTPNWMDCLLHSRVRALEASTATVAMAQGLGHLARLLNVHNDLAERDFPGLAWRVILVFARQKSLLEDQSEKPKVKFSRLFLYLKVTQQQVKDCDETASDRFMAGKALALDEQLFHSNGDSGPSTVEDIRHSFTVRAIGSSETKWSEPNLRLVWMSAQGVWTILRAGQDLSDLYPSLKIAPQTVTAIVYAKYCSKVLIKLDLGLPEESSLYLRMTTQNDVTELRKSILRNLQKKIEHQCLSM